MHLVKHVQTGINIYIKLIIIFNELVNVYAFVVVFFM